MLARVLKSNPSQPTAEIKDGAGCSGSSLSGRRGHGDNGSQVGQKVVTDVKELERAHHDFKMKMDLIIFVYKLLGYIKPI
jgi:hypothetical protein